MSTFDRLINKYYKRIISLIEKFLAFVILAALLIFIFKRSFSASVADVNSVDFIQQLISDILLMLLGLEVVRLLIVPSIQAAIELLIFVVARKTLSPSITSQDLLLDIIAFSLLIVVNKYCVKGSISGLLKKKNK